MKNLNFKLLTSVMFLSAISQVNAKPAESLKALCSGVSTAMEMGHTLEVEAERKAMFGMVKEIGKSGNVPDYLEATVLPFYEISLKKMPIKESSFFYYESCINGFDSNQSLTKHLANGINLYCIESRNKFFFGKNVRECIHNVVEDFKSIKGSGNLI